MNNTSIFEKFEQAKIADPENALRIFFEILKEIHQGDEISTLSLWQAYKSLRLKKNHAAKEFENALLARMTALLWEYQKKVDEVGSYTTLHAKEIADAQSKIASLSKRIEMVTGYKVLPGFTIRKSLW